MKNLKNGQNYEKTHFFCIFLSKNLHNIKKYITFALSFKNNPKMKRLNNKEKELIEVIRNFQSSKGRMEFEADFYFYIHQVLDNLLYPEGQ